MTNDTCYADGKPAPPDLASSVNQNTDPLHVHERTGPQRAISTIGDKDARHDGGEFRAADPQAGLRLAFLAAGLVGVVAILVLSLVPGDLRPRVAASDRLEHVLAYFCVMSAFALMARSIWRPLGAAALLALVAGLTEIAQGYVPGLHADPADALFSGLGILLGLLLSAAVTAMLRRRSGSKRPRSSG